MHRMSAFGRLDLDVACCEKAVILPPEVEEGNREYKLKLVNLTEEQFAHRLTQMNWCGKICYRVYVLQLH